MSLPKCNINPVTNPLFERLLVLADRCCAIAGSPCSQLVRDECSLGGIRVPFVLNVPIPADWISGSRSGAFFLVLLGTGVFKFL